MNEYMKGALRFAGAIAAVVALGAVFSSPTWAQVNAGAYSGSASQSASRSSSGAAAIGNQAGSYSGINIGTGGTSGASGSGAPAIGSSLNYNYSSTNNSKVEAVDLRDTVPSMWAPGLGGGGSNPCVVSGSGAAVGSGFGISIGGSWNDGECQIRESLRVLGGQLNGKAREAQVLQKNIACQSDIMRMALNQTARETGQASMKCSSVFGEDTTAPKRTRTASRAPTSSSATMSYVEAVQKCRSVSDTQYAGCMRRAKQYR